ncbi:MAG: sigma-54 dependent transcriptional regulator [Nitrospirota bacterium]|jgi:DNA-binding NtrC family response regulator
MSNVKSRILVVDDEKDICKALQFLLLGEGYEVKTAHSGEAALEILKKERFDVVLTDLKMEKVDGMAVLEEAKRLSPDTAVIIMTAYASVESAVEAMKKGAADYIVKPFINEEIRLTLRRTLEQRRLRSENIALKRELSQHRQRCKDVVFESESMERIFELIDDVAPTKSNVLLLGESGTGKSLIAEIIHCTSPRNEGPFMSINCSAIPETLLESELFGYKKGAFTGAVADKKGLVQMADGGTLFLDEIGDMPLALQAKLLKVIESGEVTPLGDTRSTYSDVRLITATNQDLPKKISEGAFREDLFYRVNVIEITIPPLRLRKEDIPLLLEHFVRKFSRQNEKAVKGFSPEATEIILGYNWPGNVRELANVVERAVVLTKGVLIQPPDLPGKLSLKAEGGPPASLKEMMNEYERGAIVSELEAHGHDKEATARALGIDLATLYRKLKKLGVEG